MIRIINCKALALAVSLILAASSPVRADQTTVSMLNELLAGELSAVETYRQALEKVGTAPGSDKLRSFHNNHVDAAKTLTTQVRTLGGTPATDSGAWGTWAKTVMGSAKIIGDETALKALREGEEHGVKEYREAIENKNVPTEIKSLIQTKFLPNQQVHIDTLNQMIKTM